MAIELNQWLTEALKKSNISQAEMSRILTTELGRSVDHAAVNKMVSGKRAIAADEMLTIEKITKFPIPHDEPNARIGPVTPLGPERIPVYGHAVGGDDGRFVMNGQQIDDVLAPPSLRSVPSAYAVYVVGESMEPRYYAGETVFVHPYIAVRRGDFVVVEIDTGDGDRLGFVKRFVSRNSKTLVLEQFNPVKQIVIPTDQVVSVHRIVMGGDG